MFYWKESFNFPSRTIFDYDQPIQVINIFDETTFATTSKNDLNFVKFQLGQKSELDRTGAGKGVSQRVI